MIQLSQLPDGIPARIVKVDENSNLYRRLFELGFVEHEEIIVRHRAPFSHDPIAVEIKGGLIALRALEANLVWVDHQKGFKNA